jgi:hypothetical protein
MDRKVSAGPAPRASRPRMPSSGTAPDWPSAASAWAQNRAGSLSPGSSDSQATGPGGWPAEAQEVSRVVLPAPGDADTSVSSCRVPSSSMANSRGRGTTWKVPPGTVILVASRGAPPSVGSWPAGRRGCGLDRAARPARCRTVVTVSSGQEAGAADDDAAMLRPRPRCRWRRLAGGWG